MPGRGRQPVDITGQRFNRMVAISSPGTNGWHRTWLCRCDCGNEKVVNGSHLRRKSWQMMHQRCGNADNANYRLYGARGVAVCARWDTFEAFLEDMGERPAGTSLDRVDGSRGYGPDNCRWATRKEQAVNTTRWAGYLDLDDRKVSVGDMAREIGLGEPLLRWLLIGSRKGPRSRWAA